MALARTRLAIGIAILAILAGACGRAPVVTPLRGTTMATTWSVQVADPVADRDALRRGIRYFGAVSILASALAVALAVVIIMGLGADLGAVAAQKERQPLRRARCITEIGLVNVKHDKCGDDNKRKN